MEDILLRSVVNEISLSAEELFAYQWAKKQFLNPDVEYIHHEKTKYVTLSNRDFHNSYPMLSGKVGWLAHRLNSLDGKGVLKRLEPKSNKWALGPNFSVLEGLSNTVYEAPESKPKPKVSIEEKIANGKKVLSDRIYAFRDANPGKYPKELYINFYNWWSEANLTTGKCRYETKDSFEVGKRLATFYARMKESGRI